MNYLQEWQASCVDEQLTHLNVTALNGYSPSEYLLYADAIPRRNDGRVVNSILQRYSHTEEGGWWCSGVDLLTGGEDMWGCFKPKYPRSSQDQGKLIKYEHPPKAPTGLFALRIPLHLWQLIAKRYHLEILPEDIQPEQPDLGFWQWLATHPNVPLCITEGAKKAGALLTAGFAAIALPGVHSGYRVLRDKWGNSLGKSRLIPQLQKLATPGREIYLAFDQDIKPNTIKAVNIAIRKTGYLLQRAGCQVKVITWEAQLGKGVDDLIANCGEGAFISAYQQATSLDHWKAELFNHLTYNAAIRLNCRYLPQVDIPATAKLIAVKSPKGTGKTKFLETVVAQAKEQNQRILVIGHRIRLVEELCQRFGLNYVTEIQNSPEGKSWGYGVCFDSLHPSSQAHFNPENWSEGIVIIDEIEQVLWHGLNSETCQSNRVAILKSLKTLMQNVLEGTGQVYVADADLSDISLDYLLSLAAIPLTPFLVTNDWKPKPQEAWQIYNYSESTPRKLVKDLENHIREGGKPFVCLSAQKPQSKWGTCNLEAYLQQQFPQLRILRIDAESLAEQDHPAYGCMMQLNRVLANYDVVLTSPAIETGVSIELQNHFTSVWAIAQGVQGENSVRQALGRVRANVPRYLWAASYGFNRVGNGSTSMVSLLASGHRLTQFNIRLLQQSDFDALDDLDIGFQAESLTCWAKMAVRFNATMINYRESILLALRREGHQVKEAKVQGARDKGDKGDKLTKQNSLTKAIEAVREQNYRGECEAIAEARKLNSQQYQALKKKIVKTVEERRSLRKHELQLRYSLKVDSELVVKDDQDWYQKLRIHYFLTVGRQYLRERDGNIARQLIHQGEGSVFAPDFNRSQLGAVIGIMEVLGIPILLQDQGRELRNTDADLMAMAKIALSNRDVIKTAVRIGLAKNSTPVTIVRRFLDKIGYSLKCLRTESKGKKRLRVYQVVHSEDNRSQVFRNWLREDERKRQVTQELIANSIYAPLNCSLSKNRDLNYHSNQDDYVQLSLEFEDGMK